ncbi:hypothetical protein OWV82_022842 [Melia azedarach]|uniref:Uncharacterized protein n=1 Tax=Melia azedarach TaxID=155640 RepID=A0ACC1WUY2_MELAZ|nr:hypothetical protein OWV82_022842 [Melia azedarach]
MALGTSKNDKKKANFKATMQQLTAFTGASGSMRGGKEKIVLESQMERNGTIHAAEWLSENIPPRAPDLVVFCMRKKKRKVGMSIEGASSSALQVEDEVKDEADTKGYVRGFSDFVSMFKGHYTEQNLAWLDQALKVIKEVEGEESENENNEDADNIRPSQGKDFLGGDPDIPTSSGSVEAVSTKQLYQDDLANNV